MLKRSVLFLTAAFFMTLTGCADGGNGVSQSTQSGGTESSSNSSQTAENTLSNPNKNSGEVTFGSTCKIHFNGEVNIDGNGAWYENGTLSLTDGGVYEISGKLEDGCVYIETDENVKLVLDNAHISNSDGGICFFREKRV